MKCKGTGYNTKEKKKQSPCGKCDTTGKMRKNKKLKTIEFLVDSKLNELYREVIEDKKILEKII